MVGEAWRLCTALIFHIHSHHPCTHLQALQRELDFELDDEELGDAFYTAAPQPHHSRALEQALQRQLSGGSQGGGREPLPSSRSPTVTATVNGVYRSSTDEAPFLGGKLP